MQFRSASNPNYNWFSPPTPSSYSNGTEYSRLNDPNDVRAGYNLMKNTHMSTYSNVKSGHTHGHGGATTCQDGHVHMHPGVSSVPIETEKGHVHKVWGNTTFDDGHIHYYEAYTSTPISLPNGYHTHYVEIKTTENDGHIHVIKGFTEPSKS